MIKDRFYKLSLVLILVLASVVIFLIAYNIIWIKRIWVQSQNPDEEGKGVDKPVSSNDPELLDFQILSAIYKMSVEGDTAISITEEQAGSIQAYLYDRLAITFLLEKVTEEMRNILSPEEKGEIARVEAPDVRLSSVQVRSVMNHIKGLLGNEVEPPSPLILTRRGKEKGRHQLSLSTMLNRIPRAKISRASLKALYPYIKLLYRYMNRMEPFESIMAIMNREQKDYIKGHHGEILSEPGLPVGYPRYESEVIPALNYLILEMISLLDKKVRG